MIYKVWADCSGIAINQPCLQLFNQKTVSFNDPVELDLWKTL